MNMDEDEAKCSNCAIDLCVCITQWKADIGPSSHNEHCTAKRAVHTHNWIFNNNSRICGQIGGMIWTRWTLSAIVYY